MQHLTSADSLKGFSPGVILAIGTSVYHPPDSPIWRVSCVTATAAASTNIGSFRFNQDLVRVCPSMSRKFVVSEAAGA